MKITILDTTLEGIARTLFQFGISSYAEMEDTAVQQFLCQVIDQQEKPGLLASYSTIGPQRLQGDHLEAISRSSISPLVRPSVQLSLFEDLPAEEEERAAQARIAESLF